MHIDERGMGSGVFRGLDKRNIFLDIGFHPTQTSLPRLLEQIKRILRSGFRIAIVNYVVSPENIDLFEAAYDALVSEGQFVQVSAMFPTGVHLSREDRSERELEILVRHNTPLNLHYKLLWPRMNRRMCLYPTRNYQLLWDGTAQISCMEESQNVFDSGFPELPAQAVPCPRYQCIGCTDMYRSLVDEPLLGSAVQNFYTRRPGPGRRPPTGLRWAPRRRGGDLAEAVEWQVKLGRINRNSTRLPGGCLVDAIE